MGWDGSPIPKPVFVLRESLYVPLTARLQSLHPIVL